MALARAVSPGDISSAQLLRDYLGRISEVEPVVQAWAFLDAEWPLAQSHAANRLQVQ